LEILEGRDVPAILIHIDYSLDTSGFFANNPTARATLETAASQLGAGLSANLAALVPSGGNTWTATFNNPATGGLVSVPNLSIGANTITVYAGARSLTGIESGTAVSGGYSASGTSDWVNTVQTRNHTGFAPWGGSIAFDPGRSWYLGLGASGLPSNQIDFYSVALHELGHVLGIGTSAQWQSLVYGGAFHGADAMSVYGGPVPVNAAGDHWANGLTINGQPASLDPSLAYGTRVVFSALDSAALFDLGWDNSTGGVATPAATPSFILVPLAGSNGVVTQYALFNGLMIPTGAQFTPFPGYHGPLRQALVDFNGDGVLDLAVATSGPGVSVLTIISGVDGHYLTAPVVTFGPVTNMFAITINGHLELIVTESSLAGVYVFDTNDSTLTLATAYTVYGVFNLSKRH
jgi:hypothetical protein